MEWFGAPGMAIKKTEERRWKRKNECWWRIETNRFEKFKIENLTNVKNVSFEFWESTHKIWVRRYFAQAVRGTIVSTNNNCSSLHSARTYPFLLSIASISWEIRNKWRERKLKVSEVTLKMPWIEGEIDLSFPSMYPPPQQNIQTLNIHSQTPSQLLTCSQHTFFFMSHTHTHLFTLLHVNSCVWSQCPILYAPCSGVKRSTATTIKKQKRNSNPGVRQVVSFIHCVCCSDVFQATLHALTEERTHAMMFDVVSPIVCFGARWSAFFSVVLFCDLVAFLLIWLSGWSHLWQWKRHKLPSMSPKDVGNKGEMQKMFSVLLPPMPCQSVQWIPRESKLIPEMVVSQMPQDLQLQQLSKEGRTGSHGHSCWPCQNCRLQERCGTAEEASRRPKNGQNGEADYRRLVEVSFM